MHIHESFHMFIVLKLIFIELKVKGYFSVSNLFKA
mgnify:CR=1 FL=1